MSLESLLFAISMGGLFLALVFYVIFGQLTVRKLRKNPKAKDVLGLEFISGWDILNVAGALALPRWINRKLRSTPLSFLYANADILDEFTSIFDRLLASILYGLFLFSSTTLILLAVFNALGVSN